MGQTSEHALANGLLGQREGGGSTPPELRQKLPTVDTLAPIRLGKRLSEFFLLLFRQLEILVFLGNEEGDGHTFLKNPLRQVEPAVDHFGSQQLHRGEKSIKDWVREQLSWLC